VRNIAENNWRLGPSFKELFGTLIDLFGEFGTGYWGFATAREQSFNPRQELIPLYDSLVALGYASVQDGAYQWTDKMAPIMEKTYFSWSEGQDDE